MILYQGLLQRKPDKEGYDSWVDFLKANGTRDYALKHFINSEEFWKKHYDYYLEPGEYKINNKIK